MIIVPTIESHFREIKLQDNQAIVNRWVLNKDYVDRLINIGEVYTFLHDGKVIAILGMFMMHEHVGSVWSIISKDAGKNLFAITKFAQSFLAKQNVARIEAVVDYDFKQGHRWAKILGFVNETPNGMAKFGSELQTCCLYARIKDGC